MPTRPWSRLLIPCLALGLPLAGCLDRDPAPLNPCTVSGVVENVRVTNVDKVDLLFMVDNSNSMAEEQASLANEFPRLVRILASGDRDGDGNNDFPPVRSLQIGVVSSDMGSGGFRVTSCNEPNFGDDGRLLGRGNTAIPGCQASYPPIATFSPGQDVDQFATDVSCVAQLGTGGCGLEQQLEAVLKATVPSTTPITFFQGTSGYGDRDPNVGFVRPDSLLAVVIVTDEEDCSTADPDLYNTASGVYTGNINLRCFNFPGAAHPIERYVDGLLSTRMSPDLLVYAAIAGIPPRLVANPSAINFDEILNDPEMQEMIDPDMPTRVRPSCNVPGVGVAEPPRRLVEVAKELEARESNGVVQSICQMDFSGALDAIIEKIADVLGGACLPRELNPDESGLVNCDVVETLATAGEFTRCDQIPGRTFLREEAVGGEMAQVCQVAQRVVADSDGNGVIEAGEAPEPGWYYDNFSADVRMRCGDMSGGGQRISFTPGAEPKTGAQVRLECLQPVQGSQGTAVIDIDTPCSGGTSCSAGGAPGDRPEARCVRDLICDSATNTYQAPCDSDAVCPAGWRCLGGRPGDAPPICVNPTCQ